jgi:hypothetical protein
MSKSCVESFRWRLDQEGSAGRPHLVVWRGVTPSQCCNLSVAAPSWIVESICLIVDCRTDFVGLMQPNHKSSILKSLFRLSS